MWYKISNSINKLNIILPDYIYKILNDISNIQSENGGKGLALIVGGAVRDAILGIESKDVDFEVYNVSYEQLVNILSEYGKSDIVGMSFGVVKFKGPDGADFDFSLPRKDNKSGTKHTDFDIQVSSSLSPSEAAERRDLKINAISYNPLTKEIIDPFNGIADIHNKELNYISESFAEDPLRVLRMIQFASRFGFKASPELIQLSKAIKDQFKHLPKERVKEEFRKMILKGKDFHAAFELLKLTEWIEHFPALHNLDSTIQDSEWHPEGWKIEKVNSHKFIASPIEFLTIDNLSKNYKLPEEIVEPDEKYTCIKFNISEKSVINLMQQDENFINKISIIIKQYLNANGFDNFDVVKSYFSKDKKNITFYDVINIPDGQFIDVSIGDAMTHTAHVMQQAARIADEKNLSELEREILMYSALLHDSAKAETTVIRDKNGKHRVTSHGHEKAGRPVARQFLESIGESETKIRQIEKLVEFHLAHIYYQNEENTDSFVKKLADSLFPAKISQLINLIEADHSGRPPLESKMPEQAENLHQHAEKLNLHNIEQKPEPPIKGIDVIKYIPPGKEVGEILAEAKNLWLKDSPYMNDREAALLWLKERLFKPFINGNDVLEHTYAKPGKEVGYILNLAKQMQETHQINSREDGIKWLKTLNKD